MTCGGAICLLLAKQRQILRLSAPHNTDWGHKELSMLVCPTACPITEQPANSPSREHSSWADIRESPDLFPSRMHQMSLFLITTSFTCSKVQPIPVSVNQCPAQQLCGKKGKEPGVNKDHGDRALLTERPSCPHTLA